MYYLKKILLCVCPFGAKPVVVFVRGIRVEEVEVGVKSGVEPCGVVDERGVEPGRGGHRRGRGRRHVGVALAPRAPPRRSATALRTGRAIHAPRALLTRHETIQLGSRSQYYHLHHHTLLPTSRSSTPYLQTNTEVRKKNVTCDGRSRNSKQNYSSLPINY